MSSHFPHTTQPEYKIDQVRLMRSLRMSADCTRNKSH